MSWCKLYDTDADGLETVLLAEALGCSTVEALGWCARLWVWATRHAQDGGLPSGARLEASLGWAGEAGALWRGLVAAQVVLDDVRGARLAEWDERYQLAGQARRKRAEREARRAQVRVPQIVPVEVVDGPSADSPRTVLGQSQDCPSPLYSNLSLDLSPQGESREGDEGAAVAWCPTKGKPVAVTAAKVAELEARHPELDVRAELTAAVEWAEGKRADWLARGGRVGTRRREKGDPPTEGGVGAFLGLWMRNAATRPAPVASGGSHRPRPGEVMADLGRRLEEAQARGLGDGGYAALGALSAERRAEARARAAGGGS